MGFLTTCAKMLFEESNMIEIIKESNSLNIGQSICDIGAVEWIKVIYCDCWCDTDDDDNKDDDSAVEILLVIIATVDVKQMTMLDDILIEIVVFLT